MRLTRLLTLRYAMDEGKTARSSRAVAGSNCVKNLLAHACPAAGIFSFQHHKINNIYIHGIGIVKNCNFRGDLE